MLSEQQDNDYRWYVDHYAELSRKYPNQYIAIKDKAVIAAAPTYADGVAAGEKVARLGEFIVQYCDGTDELPKAYVNAPCIDMESFIRRLEKTWKGTDCDEFMDMVRGRGEGDGRG